MQHRLRLAVQLLLVVFSLIASLPLAAQAGVPTGAPQATAATLSGRITRNGVGEAGVIVELYALNGLQPGALIAASTTDAVGRYSFANRPASFFLRPRKGVFEFNPPFVRRLQLIGSPVNDVTQDFTMIAPPIVIQGGYSPMSLPQSSCPQRRLDNSTYNPGACGEVEFASLLAQLRGAGWNVRTVMMNSSILGTPALATQTSALRRAINDAKAATGASKVIVFAHSTGGPVARRYIESSAFANDVSHLFTFGSQHLGNPVEDTADIWLEEILPAFLRQTAVVPEALISALIRVIDATVDDQVNFLCTTRLFSFTIPQVGAFSVPGPGQTVLCETSPSGMANFNQAFRPRAGVQYHLIHGRNVRSDDMSLLGRTMTAAIPGADDTLIQTTSAIGFTFNGPHDRLLTRDPHMTQTSTGNRYYLNTNGAFDSAFVLCIRPMFITRTLSESSCGTVSAAQAGTAFASWAGEDAVAPAEIGAVAAEVAAEVAEQKTLPRSAHLPDTATVITQPVRLVESGAATFLASWITGTVSLTLVDPNGAVITPAVASGDVQYFGDATRASYVFSAAQPGTYTMRLQASAAPADGLLVHSFAAPETAYTLTTARSRNWLPPAGTITVTAVFTGPTAIANPAVTALVSGSSGVSETVAFDNLGNGSYRYVYTAPDAPGYVEMEIVGTGTVNGAPIERNDNVSFTIYPDSFKPTGSYSEVVSRSGVTINVGLRATYGVRGDFRVTGILADGAGRDVAVATTIGSAEPGAAIFSVPLFFDGATLYEAGVNGPFTLRRLLVVDEREHAQVSADDLNVYTTSAIDVGRFALKFVYLPILTR